MYAEGLLDEVRSLKAKQQEWSATARHAIGYAEASAVLEGRMSLEAAVDRTIIRTRQLAKRQMTWFRGQADVKWVDVREGESVERLAEQVLQLWREHGPTPVEV